MGRRAKDDTHTSTMVAVIFSESEKKIFDEYKKTFGFKTSTDAYKGLLDLVETRWTGIQLKNNQHFSIRLSVEDYDELNRIRERLGGISRTEVLRRGIDFLHDIIPHKEELLKWKEFAAGIPRFIRTGKKKLHGLAEGKTVIYTMNDLSGSILKEVCEIFGENRTGALRLALKVAAVLPPEKLFREDEGKFHSTVRLKRDDFIKMEQLKSKINNNINGVFRTGLLIAAKEVKKRKLGIMDEVNQLSKESSLYKMTEEIPADTVRQDIILKP